MGLPRFARRSPGWGASKKKKPYAAHKIFYSRLRAKASFALAGNKKTGRVPGFFFFGGEGGTRMFVFKTSHKVS